jgi:hypothetical protein
VTEKSQVYWQERLSLPTGASAGDGPCRGGKESRRHLQVQTGRLSFLLQVMRYFYNPSDEAFKLFPGFMCQQNLLGIIGQASPCQPLTFLYLDRKAAEAEEEAAKARTNQAKAWKVTLPEAEARSLPAEECEEEAQVEQGVQGEGASASKPNDDQHSVFSSHGSPGATSWPHTSIYTFSAVCRLASAVSNHLPRRHQEVAWGALAARGFLACSRSGHFVCASLSVYLARFKYTLTDDRQG